MGGMGGMNMMGMGGMGGMNMMGMGGMGQNCLGFNQANGGLGMMGSTMNQGLILLIQQVVAPGEWGAMRCQTQPFGMPGMFPNNPGGMPPVPTAQGGPAADIRNSNTIGFYAPSLALVVRGTSQIHTKYGGLLGGTPKTKLEPLAPEEVIAKPDPKGKDKFANNADPKKMQVAGDKDLELDPRKIWQDALANGLENPGLIIAAADFLVDNGLFLDAAEFLKANLRQGILVRPWIYEALAVALEATNGSPEEIRRARLSAVALDPQNAEGFLKAAQAMSDHKQYDRALAFCKQAAQLQPNSPHAYTNALVYAEVAKDQQGIEWAATNLLEREWPVDNHALQLRAQAKLDALAGTLEADKRKTEASKVRDLLQKLRQRDLTINLTWEAGSSGPAGLELWVKESSGTICSMEHRMSPGGGILSGGTLEQLTKFSYVAAQAFSGEYEIKVRRLWGEPLGGKARLEIIQHQGTDKKVHRIETLSLNEPVTTLKLKLENGRRTALAVIPPPSAFTTPAKEAKQPQRILEKLRDIADPYYTPEASNMNFGKRPGVLTRDEAFGTDSSKKFDNVVYQNGIAPQSNNGLSLNTQVVTMPNRGFGVTVTPVIQRGAFVPRGPATMPGIPGTN